jgi:hypothetical protein
MADHLIGYAGSILVFVCGLAAAFDLSPPAGSLWHKMLNLGLFLFMWGTGSLPVILVGNGKSLERIFECFASASVLFFAGALLSMIASLIILCLRRARTFLRERAGIAH